MQVFHYNIINPKEQFLTYRMYFKKKVICIETLNYYVHKNAETYEMNKLTERLKW